MSKIDDKRIAYAFKYNEALALTGRRMQQTRNISISKQKLACEQNILAFFAWKCSMCTIYNFQRE